MNIRSISTLLGAAVMLAAGGAHAQQATTPAGLADLQGSVLVSQGDAMVAATNGQRVAAGARVLTLAGGKVVIRYDSGCDVTLKENQRFTVRVGECPVLLAEVVTIAPAPVAGAGAAAATGVSTNAVLGTLGVAALGYGAYEMFKSDSVSPN